MEDKIKCWVVYCDEFPMGLVHQSRSDALENAADERWAGNKAYTRVKYFTKSDLETLPDAD